MMNFPFIFYYIIFVFFMSNLIFLLDLFFCRWFKMVKFDSWTDFCIVDIYLIFIIQINIFSWWFTHSTFIISILRWFGIFLIVYFKIHWSLFLCRSIYFLFLCNIFSWLNRWNNFFLLLLLIRIGIKFIFFFLPFIYNLKLDILQVNTWLGFWIRILLCIIFRNIILILINLDRNLWLLTLQKDLKGIFIQS